MLNLSQGFLYLVRIHVAIVSFVYIFISNCILTSSSKFLCRFLQLLGIPLHVHGFHNRNYCL